MKKLQFGDMALSKPVLRAVSDMGFEEASPIQSETIPHLLQGSDVIGMAQTGTGKTAAFAIPAIEKLEAGSKALQAVVLCPTRELVIQVTEEFRRLMKYMSHFSVVPVYGGQDIGRQLKALNGRPQVIVGTPGRTMDHMRRGSIDLASVKTVVLDEADEMLDMGFRDDIEFILKETPETRQTVMFSATMPPDIIKLTKRYQRDPVRIDVTSRRVNAPDIEQSYFEIQSKAKPEALARLIDLHDTKIALVFCNTKSRVDELVEILKSRGYSAEGLHGGLNQKQRDKVMSGFRKGKIEILVATDVAGRGIDVSGIEAVFNFDLPRDDEDYIHRIGRTARAGKSGRAFTFITGREIYSLKRIEKINGMRITRGRIPSLDELDETRMQAFDIKIREAAAGGVSPKSLAMVERLMGEEYTSLDIAAALLAILIERENGGFDGGVSFEQAPPARRGYEKHGTPASRKGKAAASGKSYKNAGSSKGWKGRQKRGAGKSAGRKHGGMTGSPK
jgi:ATP-dependent RNA helicase DeaD